MVRFKYLLSVMSIALGSLLPSLAAISPASAQIVEGYDLSKLPPHVREKVRVNAGAVSILVSGATCTCARFTEDIRYVVNDVNNPRPGGVRLVPVLGEGGIQNLKDLLFLRGISMSIVDESTIRVLKERNPQAYGDIETKLRYITKLYNAELHILARKNIQNVSELNGKIVNFDYKDSETDLVATRVFKAMGINPEVTHDDQRYAMQRLRSGEIAAVVISTGAPQNVLTRIRPEENLHLLPIDEASLPGTDLGALLDEYLPTELTHENYPNLIAEGKTVPTVASRVLLAIYNWPDDSYLYPRATKFIREFFSRIDEFRNPARHPKWKDVNLAAEVPGWTRFSPAQQWLDENESSLTTVSADAGGQIPSDFSATKTAFERFLLQQGGGNENVSLSVQERALLFAEFQKFLASQQKQ